MTCLPRPHQAAHNAVDRSVGVRADRDAAALEAPLAAAQRQHQVDGRHQQRGLARAERPVHDAQRGGRRLGVSTRY